MPMTAVGKIFRPVLREQISTAVLTEHLAKAGIVAEVACKADNKTGMNASVKLQDATQQSAAQELLSSYNVVVHMTS